MNETKTAGGVVMNHQGQVLVVNQNHNSWSLPKGHIDPGENARQAAIREIEEESGITELVFLKELGSYQRFKIALGGGDDKSELKTIEMFLFTTPQTALAPRDADNPEARWVEVEEVAGLLTHTKDRAFFEGVMEEVRVIARNGHAER